MNIWGYSNEWTFEDFAMNEHFGMSISQTQRLPTTHRPSAQMCNNQVQGCPMARGVDVQRPDARMSYSQAQRHPTTQLSIAQPGARMFNGQGHWCPATRSMDVHQPSAKTANYPVAKCMDAQQPGVRMSINLVHNVCNSTGLRWWVYTDPDPPTTAIKRVWSH